MPHPKKNKVPFSPKFAQKPISPNYIIQTSSKLFCVSKKYEKGKWIFSSYNLVYLIFWKVSCYPNRCSLSHILSPPAYLTNEVLFHQIMRDPDTGNSKGYAFINFASFEAADMAIEAMNGQYLCNRAIAISYAFKKDSKGERHGSAAGEWTMVTTDLFS